VPKQDNSNVVTCFVIRERAFITLSLPCGEQNSTIRRVNYWNIIADTLDSLNKARLWNSRNLRAPDKDAH
jgi:hypothetical protein